MMIIAKWPAVCIGEIAGLGQYGLNAPALKEGKGTRFIRITDINDHGDLRPDSMAYVAVTNKDSQKYAVNDGDILIARSGATAGKSLLVKAKDLPAVFAGYLIRFQPDTRRIMPEFLGAFLRSGAYWEQIEATKRVVAQPNVNAQELAQIDLLLPPLEEQRRIVDILNHAASIRRLRDEARTKARQVIPALFVEMFGNPATNPKGWPIQTLGDVISRFEGGKNLQAGDDAPGGCGLQILKVSAVTSGIFRPSECKPAPNGYEPPQGHFVRAGDLLFSRANTVELVGATAFVHEQPHNILLPDKLYQVPLNQTHVGHSQDGADLIQHGKHREVCHGGCDWASRGFHCIATA